MRRIAQDSRGATAVEFAMVAVPFFGLILLILQVGLYHFSIQSLDYATRLAGRQVMTGQVPTTITSASGFKTALICPKVFWTISCGDVVVNAYRVGTTSNAADSSGIYAFVNSAAKSLNAPQTDAAKQSFCLGGPGDYVFIDVAYPYPNFVGRLLSAGASSTVQLRSTTFIFNEPYRTASATGSC